MAPVATGCLFQFVTSTHGSNYPASRASQPVTAPHQPGLCVRITCAACRAGTPRAAPETRWIRCSEKQSGHVQFHTASQVILVYTHRCEPLPQDKVPTYLNNTE